MRRKFPCAISHGSGASLLDGWQGADPDSITVVEVEFSTWARQSWLAGILMET